MTSGGIDFTLFHSTHMPAVLARNGGGEAAAADVGRGAPLALRLVDADGAEVATYTYAAVDGAVTVTPGAAASAAIAALDADAFDDLALERCTIFSLLFSDRLKVVRGRFDEVANWETALTNLWFDRPIYDGDLSSLDGVDLSASFRLSDCDDDIAAFLHTTGFVLLRGVFTAEEIATLDAEVELLRSQATPDDRRSWWATNSAGEEVCCRVTYGNLRSAFMGTLHEDDRLKRIASWHGSALRPSFDRLDGFGVVIKNSDVVSGMSDLPWHRDCGMGGHPTLCPSLAIGIQLDVADAANGQLLYLAGSHHHTNRAAEVARHPQWPVVPVVAQPGDVTVHYSHVLHVAPPPTSGGAGRRTVYVTFNNPAVFDVIGEGEGYNDVVFSRGGGRVLSPAELSA